MEDLFKALIQGSGQQTSGEETTEDPLSGILQGMLGGSNLGGSQPSAEMSPGLGGAGGLDLASLLQGLLGGGGALGATAPEASPEETSGISSGGMGDILGAILGGGGQAGSSAQETAGTGAGGLGGILGAVLGGGSTAAQSDPFTSAIANLLSKKLGLSPQLAQVVVVFVLGKLLKGRSQAASGASAQAGVQGMSLDSLLGRMNSGATVRKADVRASGMARELAAYTGMDRRTAEASLQEVLNALGGQVGSKAPARTPRKPKESGLDSMLDEWPK